MTDDLETTFIDMPERLRSAELGQFIPSTSSVDIFLDTLRSTTEYQRIISQRYSKAEEISELSVYVAGDNLVTEREVAEAYEETEEFKALFWDFNEDCVHLAYNPASLPIEFNKAFEDYKKSVYESLRSVEEAGGVESIRAKDHNRSGHHNEAARVLVDKGLVASEFVGRIIVRAFLVDIGMDYVKSARLGDLQRRLRDAPDRRSLAKAIETDIHLNRKNKFFSLERAKEIQEEFCRRGLSEAEVDRISYINEKNTTSFDLKSLFPSGFRRHDGDAENERFPIIHDVRNKTA